jgi:hypothetical protein
MSAQGEGSESETNAAQSWETKSESTENPAEAVKYFGFAIDFNSLGEDF